jgi:hypothetical protein
VPLNANQVLLIRTKAINRLIVRNIAGGTVTINENILIFIIYFLFSSLSYIGCLMILFPIKIPLIAIKIAVYINIFI